ncbi:MAG: hypothetical protein LBU22_13325, partial [Dysgonamonadaceae bacterium]|nr:hypothetical protein [Dysgonamonadaceae bacterium]
INDPKRIEKDANNEKYSNLLLNKTLRKYETNNRIFDHFFLRQFTNEERWNFIEDFFLGSEDDDLLNAYKGIESKNEVDIIEFLKSNAEESKNNEINTNSENNNVHIFYAKPDAFYNMDNLLTMDTKEGTKTMRVTEWLVKDPVCFDIARRDNKG